MKKKLILASIALLATLAWAQPMDFKHYGHFMHMMHTGETAGQIQLSKLETSTGVWGVGALADLKGEIIQVDGRDGPANRNRLCVKGRFGLDYVHLDISHQPADFVKGHFPTIYDKLMGLGIDMTTQPIPVVPAQHYTCGGVVVGLDARTDVPGLWAAGECTESGLHGANRLASNSLLECFVFGEAAAQEIRAIAAQGAQLQGTPLHPLRVIAELQQGFGIRVPAHPGLHAAIEAWLGSGASSSA